MSSFWDGVAQNLVADVLLASLITAAAIVYSYWRFSGAKQHLANTLLRRRPDRRVLVSSLPDQPLAVQVNPSTPFGSPLTNEERADLVEFYAHVNGSTPFNGRAVRLDQVTPRLAVSQVGFFDLLTTNFTAYPDNIPVAGVFRRLAATRRWLRLRGAMERVSAAADVGGSRPRSVAAALSNTSMANVVAVSVLLADDAGRVAVAYRAGGVAVASGRYSATVAGTVTDTDLEEPDPFLEAALRETREEIGLDVPALSLDALVMPLKKMQPIFCYSGTVVGRWEEYASLIASAPSFRQETARMDLVSVGDLNELTRLLQSGALSETAAYQLWLRGVAVHGEIPMQRSWRKKRYTPGQHRGLLTLAS